MQTHTHTNTHMHALALKVISLICLSTPFLPPLFAHILETPDSRWISMSKTRRQRKRCNLFILSSDRECRCVRALVCVCVLYVQRDWWGVGLFICLVWSWLSVTGPRREYALCDLPDKSHPSAVCICQGPGSSAYHCTHPFPSIMLFIYSLFSSLSTYHPPTPHHPQTNAVLNLD